MEIQEWGREEKERRIRSILSLFFLHVFREETIFQLSVTRTDRDIGTGEEHESLVTSSSSTSGCKKLPINFILLLFLLSAAAVSTS
jgi:hypothetical protein